MFTFETLGGSTFSAPPGLDTPAAMPRLPQLLTSRFTNAGIASTRSESGKKDPALKIFRPPPGLEHLRNDELLANKASIAHCRSLHSERAEEAVDVFTVDTAPPSPGSTSDSCDGLASEDSVTPRTLAARTTMRLADTGYSPGHMLIQETIGAKAAIESDQRIQTLSLCASLDDENTSSDVGLPGQPSVGSVYHHMNLCRPCDFVYRKGGCRSGTACQFCHLCKPDEGKHKKKLRSKLMKIMQRESMKGSM